jgi:hypothetical protein
MAWFREFGVTPLIGGSQNAIFWYDLARPPGAGTTRAESMPQFRDFGVTPFAGCS